MPKEWELHKVREDIVDTEIELTLTKKEQKWKNLITGSSEKRAMAKNVRISELCLANQKAIKIMPLTMLRVLTFLSGDPEGYKEMHKR